MWPFNLRPQLRQPRLQANAHLGQDADPDVVGQWIAPAILHESLRHRYRQMWQGHSYVHAFQPASLHARLPHRGRWSRGSITGGGAGVLQACMAPAARHKRRSAGKLSSGQRRCAAGMHPCLEEVEGAIGWIPQAGLQYGGSKQTVGQLGRADAGSTLRYPGRVSCSFVDDRQEVQAPPYPQAGQLPSQLQRSCPSQSPSHQLQTRPTRAKTSHSLCRSGRPPAKN